MDFPPILQLNTVKTGRSIVFLVTSPVDGYTYSEPFLKISSLHLILAYHAGTTLSMFYSDQKMVNFTRAFLDSMCPEKKTSKVLETHFHLNIFGTVKFSAPRTIVNLD